MTKRILIVDDDSMTISLVEGHLKKSGFEVMSALEGSRGIHLAHSWKPDLILVDVMMPNLDGYTVTKRIREFSSTPIIILTARGEEREKLKGFEAGADDYISKPFSFVVLIARIKAVLRRFETGHLEKYFKPVYRHDDLIVDVEGFRVTVSGEEVYLSSTELNLLKKLAESMGEVVTSEELLASVWGPDFREDKTILWVAVSRLKQKIEKDPKNPEHIHTIKGVGYSMPKESSFRRHDQD
jgi:DNA-binding response OmpR family regulator